MSDLNSRHNRAVWFDIPVSDLDRAVKFYRSVLGVSVTPESFGDIRFAVIEHGEGNGGCLVPQQEPIPAGQGILLYLNVNGRIQDAVRQVQEHGGEVQQAVHAIGPHGYRAVIVDSEGNRVALHSETGG